MNIYIQVGAPHDIQVTSPPIGQRLRAVRQQQGLSQLIVHRRSGLDPSYLSRIEKGKVQPTVPTLMRIAEALRVSVSDLLAPSPRDRLERPCPVSPSGHCLMDLADIDAAAPKNRQPGRFTRRQIRLLRRFADVLQTGDPEVVKAFEVLFGKILDQAGSSKKEKRARTV